MFENEQSDEVKNRVKAEKMWDYRCVKLTSESCNSCTASALLLSF
jgi:hypothetical protein